MRSGPRGPRRSVDRGACRPAIEPRQPVTTGCRRGRATRKATWTGALLRALVWTSRGRRPRHARKLLVREPGDLSPDRPEYRAVRVGKAGGPKPMMRGREKSDPAVVAMKPAKSAAPAAGELVERRAGAKGKAEQVARTGHRAGHACISNLLRLRHVYTLPLSPEVGARCLNPSSRIGSQKRPLRDFSAPQVIDMSGNLISTFAITAVVKTYPVFIRGTVCIVLCHVPAAHRAEEGRQGP